MAKPTQLTTQHLMEMFQVSSMTIHNWRRGSTRITPLPHHTQPKGTKRHSVSYRLSEVKQWAKKNGMVIMQST